MPPRDQLGMLDDVGRMADDARHDDLAVGQLDVLPQRPFVLVADIAGLEAVGLRVHLEDEIDDVLHRNVMRMRAVPAAPAEMVAHRVLGDAASAWLSASMQIFR